MTALILWTTLLSHGMNLVPLIRKISRGEGPTAIDFTALSFVLYFDLGLIFEAFGYKTELDFVSPFFRAAPAIQCFAVFLIVAAPWLIRIGALIGATKPTKDNVPTRPALSMRTRYTFYIITIAICTITALYGMSALRTADNIWVDRAQLSLTLGPYVVFLYLPLYILGFFSQLRDASTPWGYCFSSFLIASSVLSTLAIGERTLILLPLLILTLATARVRLRNVFLAGGITVVLATLLLPLLKWQFSTGRTTSEMVLSLIYGDFDRAPIMIRSIESSEMFGTRIMQYPGEGYVYAALLPIPRAIAPFKGYSTATWFTADVADDKPETITWGLGISAIDEIMLNFGYMFVIPGLLVYGAAFGLLGRMEDSISGLHIVPGLRVPLRLAAIWFLGYDLPALLLTYGFMTVTCVVLSWMWTDRRRPSDHETICPSGGIDHSFPAVRFSKC